jgi:hypothetical protein
LVFHVFRDLDWDYFERLQSDHPEEVVAARAWIN